jgi:2-polyprenyl-3-methyl-5-hydroxy-6-metoxy-1,4-benzoquinol methylase
MQIEQRHKYEYAVDLDSDSGPARVVRMVGEYKRVLEIGAGPGSITKLLTSVSNCRVTVLDIDAESIKKLAPYCERAYQADLNNAAWPKILEQEKKFEVLVAADVLEHVYEPLVVLKAMKGFLNEDGYMVISLPHVGHSVIHACMLEEDFEYGEFGLLDRTHIRFFGMKNIQKLFEDAGLKIVHAEFVVRDPYYTEFSKRWARTSQELRNVLAKNPFGLVYQVIVKTVPDKASGEAINLMKMPVLPQVISFRDSLRIFLCLHLSEKMYLKLIELNGLRRKYFVKK